MHELVLPKISCFNFVGYNELNNSGKTGDVTINDGDLYAWFDDCWNLIFKSDDDDITPKPINCERCGGSFKLARDGSGQCPYCKTYYRG